MPKSLYTLTLLAALLGSTVAYAQENAVTEATENAVEQAADAASDAATAVVEEAKDTATEAVKEVTGENTVETGENDAAESAGEENAQNTEATQEQTANAQETAPKEDPSYVKETHGDWVIKCFRVEEGEEPCHVFQLLKEENGNPIAEFSLFRLKQGKAVAGATIIVPLGTLLTDQLKVSIDGGQARNYPFAFCTLIGCYARIGLTESDISSFKRGAKANLTIVPAQAPDQKVNIDVSLTGFTDAYESVASLPN